MGHTNVDTTLNVYTQVLDGSLRAAVDKVGGELIPSRRKLLSSVIELNGGPSRTRTCDLLVRSQTLYPTELWALRGVERNYEYITSLIYNRHP